MAKSPISTMSFEGMEMVNFQTGTKILGTTSAQWFSTDFPMLYILEIVPWCPLDSWRASIVAARVAAASPVMRLEGLLDGSGWVFLAMIKIALALAEWLMTINIILRLFVAQNTKDLPQPTEQDHVAHCRLSLSLSPSPSCHIASPNFKPK